MLKKNGILYIFLIIFTFLQNTVSNAGVFDFGFKKTLLSKNIYKNICNKFLENKKTVLSVATISVVGITTICLIKFFCFKKKGIANNDFLGEEIDLNSDEYKLINAEDIPDGEGSKFIQDAGKAKMIYHKRVLSKKHVKFDFSEYKGIKNFADDFDKFSNNQQEAYKLIIPDKVAKEVELSKHKGFVSEIMRKIEGKKDITENDWNWAKVYAKEYEIEGPKSHMTKNGFLADATPDYNRFMKSFIEGHDLTMYYFMQELYANFKKKGKTIYESFDKKEIRQIRKDILGSANKNIKLINVGLKDIKTKDIQNLHEQFTKFKVWLD